MPDAPSGVSKRMSLNKHEVIEREIASAVRVTLLVATFGIAELVVGIDKQG